MLEELFGATPDVLDLLWDFGGGSVFAFVLRVLGLVSVLVGLGAWLGLGFSFLYVPAALVCSGLVVFAVSLFLSLLER